MSQAMESAPPRAVIEHLVRQSVYARLGKPLPHVAAAPNPLDKYLNRPSKWAGVLK